MGRRTERNVVGGIWTWAVVVVAGFLVLGLVWGLDLVPRLRAGQDVIDGVRPVFVEERVAGDVAAISMVSAVVDLADPLVTSSGGAAAEVPELVAFVAEETGLSAEEVVAVLSEEVPHTTGLLQAIPLEEVTAEVPALVSLLSSVLEVSEADVVAVLDAEFPALKQSIDAVGVVTGGWDDVASQFPDAGPLTRFDGSDVVSVPDVRDYFALDVIPAVASVRDDYQRLEATAPPVDWFPFLLTVLGAIVVVYASAMILIVRRPLVPGVGELRV